VVRVMVEATDEETAEEMAGRLVDLVEHAAR
jgi:phosphomannomutase